MDSSMSNRTATFALAFALSMLPCNFALAADQRERIVFIGDSITDGHTYPLLFEASLKRAGRPLPICINAGVAGDTAQGMLARLDRDVFSHHPTLVTLSAGINDVLHGVSTADYARDMEAIAARMARENIPLVILTPSILGSKHAEAEMKLSQYIAALRKIALAHDCRVAEVHRAMEIAAARGEELLEADEVHLNMAGYRHFTRAILDATGYEEVEVAPELKYELMPGGIESWQVRAEQESETALDESNIVAASEAGQWQAVSLPLAEKEDHWWMDQERQRGFAVSLGRRIGPGKKFLAKTVVTADATEQAYLNVGGQVDRMWLNGTLIYKSEGWRGWHAGKERIFVTFSPGENILLLETGDTYFLSRTLDNRW
jgi:lysophospholipase L1-like esterase